MKKYVIGIDEVGRGPLAGPVVVVAVAIQSNSKFHIPYSRIKLKDSKKLTPKQRKKWFKYVKNHPEISYALARVTPKVIDRINISKAANLAATRALTRLLATRNKRQVHRILLDGGLYTRVNQRRYPRISASTITKGDEKYKAIKLASIVAKVLRDRYMSKVCHKKFPHYGFDVHKGYGTKKHYLVLKKHGLTPIHRRSFI